jgi:hypothetical protein
MDQRRPPWREPMLWLVVGLPVGSIVAGVLLLIAAERSGGSDSIADRVQSTAQIQVADLGPDERARDLKLSAIVRSGRGVLEVLPVAGSFDRAAPLRVELRHPARADLDRGFDLAPDANGWRTDARIDGSHGWIVQLQPRDGRWRLQGRLPKGQHAAYLAPTLGEGR